MKYLNKENIFIFNGILLAIILIVILISIFKTFVINKIHRAQDFAPQIAGQTVPEDNFIIDFSKRYNVYCKGENEEYYKNVKILGYTGKKVRTGKDFLSESYEHFNRWLVLEQLDNRKIFLNVYNITVLEEVE